MKIFVSKGKRIRASDKKLLFNFVAARLVLVFLIVLLLFHTKGILAFDWSGFSLLCIDGAWLSSVNMPYLITSGIVALLVCGVVVCLYCRLCGGSIMGMKYRQALARMIVENKWYESETEKSDSFFKDMPSLGSKERITYFPKMYYRFEKSRIYLLVEITMGRSQGQLAKLEKKVESGLFCELVDKTAKEPFIEYVFFYDLSNTRIDINEVNIVNGRIELMRDFYWNYDKLPHALIVGGTGSGKSYFILTLIKSFLDSNATLHALDPKNAALADLAAVMPNVYHRPEDIIACVDRFCEDMLARNEEMKAMPNYRTGGNYASLGLEPNFLIFDEYVAFMEMLEHKEVGAVMGKLKQISMLGRQSGYFLILACQRPDAKYLADGIRDQFHFRVALDRNSELGYKMIFGDTDKVFMTMPAGRGYVDSGTSVISELYAPFVTEGYDFLYEIKKTVCGMYDYEESWQSTTPDMFDDMDIEKESAM